MRRFWHRARGWRCCSALEGTATVVRCSAVIPPGWRSGARADCRYRPKSSRSCAARWTGKHSVAGVPEAALRRAVAGLPRRRSKPAAPKRGRLPRQRNRAPWLLCMANGRSHGSEQAADSNPHRLVILDSNGDHWKSERCGPRARFGFRRAVDEDAGGSGTSPIHRPSSSPSVSMLRLTLSRCGAVNHASMGRRDGETVNE